MTNKETKKLNELIINLRNDGFLVFEIFHILRCDIEYIYKIIDN
jgi:hypothetical protein